MINRIIILVILIMTISCKSNKSDSNLINYRETKTSFFDLAHGDWTKNSWIRKPENLKMVNETFKMIGYLNLIPTDFISSNEFLIRDVYIKKNFFKLFDSLQITYGLDTIESKYYRDFWERRRLEKNDSMVFAIVKDINLITKQKIIPFCPKCANDTLYDLLRLQFRTDSLTNELATQDFQTLKKYGFHQSAYNLLYERADYMDIKWKKDSLVMTLDTSSNYSGAWIDDNTK